MPSAPSHAIAPIYALVQFLLIERNLNLKHNFNSMLHKIDSVKEIFYIYICKYDTAFRRSIVNVTYYHVVNDQVLIYIDVNDA